MNDELISRAAAIDALKEAFNPSITNFVKAKMAIDNLPPAQSEVRTQMSSADCISRQSAIDRINKQREHLRPDIYEQDYIGDAAYRICAEFIERLPSAQPESDKKQLSRLIRAGIIATDMKDVYSCGMRNGMRWCRSLLDDKEPKFEDASQYAQPERKKGRWIPQDNNKITNMASTLVFYYPKCSECGHSGNYTNFCPRCGADMREGNA